MNMHHCHLHISVSCLLSCRDIESSDLQLDDEICLSFDWTVLIWKSQTQCQIWLRWLQRELSLFSSDTDEWRLMRTFLCWETVHQSWKCCEGTNRLHWSSKEIINSIESYIRLSLLNYKTLHKKRNLFKKRASILIHHMQ